MKLLNPPVEIAYAGLRALKTVAIVDGELHALERRFLEAVQRSILKTDFDVAELLPIVPEQLAAAVMSAEFRERILSACIIMAMIDGELSSAEGSLLEQYARAFEISSHALTDVKRLIDRNLTVARIDIARRSFLGQRGRAYLAAQGVRGLARTMRSLLGIENRGLAARYQALADLPRGTLGREYFEFVRASGFSLPGEKNGAPEVIVFHDCLHVLAGYGTSSLEETQIASFQSGVLRKDPVFGLMFMLAQFHLGVQITPVTAAEKLAADPQLMLEAFVRGTKVSRDLCVDWVPQSDFARSVDELRREYNIVPRELTVSQTAA
jgi:tellurite resistance protein